MAYEFVLLDRVAGVGRVTLNRPDSLNALTAVMLNEIYDALDGCRRDPAVRVVVIAGAGRGFCSGRDISHGWEDESNVPEPNLGIERYNRVMRIIRQIEKPVVAAINGAVAGGGYGIPLACDIRIASDRAKFVTAFGRVGLNADSGVAYWLPKIIGHQRATELLFSGRVVGAEEALAIGLVDEVVPGDQLDSRASEVAARHAQGPTKAIGLTKRILGNSWQLPLAAHLDFEAHAQTLTGQSHDFAEGVKAFQEKRDPRFEGR